MFQSNAFSSLPDDNTTGGVDDFVFDGDDDDWILDEEDDFEKEMSVTENGDDKRIMIHSIRSESFKMRNPCHN